MSGIVNSPEVLIEVRGLCVDYGLGDDAVHAVVDAGLELRRGEVLGLAGESGSGKSTLAYAITRLLRPPGVITAGSARLRCQATGSGSRARRSTCSPPASASSGGCAGTRSRSCCRAR